MPKVLAAVDLDRSQFAGRQTAYMPVSAVSVPDPATVPSWLIPDKAWQRDLHHAFVNLRRVTPHAAI